MKPKQNKQKFIRKHYNVQIAKKNSKKWVACAKK